MAGIPTPPCKATWRSHGLLSEFLKQWAKANYEYPLDFGVFRVFLSMCILSMGQDDRIEFPVDLGVFCGSQTAGIPLVGQQTTEFPLDFGVFCGSHRVCILSMGQGNSIEFPVHLGVFCGCQTMRIPSLG